MVVPVFMRYYLKGRTSFVPLNINKTESMTELIPYLDSLEHYILLFDENLPWIFSYFEVASSDNYTLSYDLYFTDMFMEGKLLGQELCFIQHYSS